MLRYYKYSQVEPLSGGRLSIRVLVQCIDIAGLCRCYSMFVLICVAVYASVIMHALYAVMLQSRLCWVRSLNCYVNG